MHNSSQLPDVRVRSLIPAAFSANQTSRMREVRTGMCNIGWDRFTLGKGEGGGVPGPLNYLKWC